MKLGSAYDLFLARTLQHAVLVRGVEGTAVFDEQHLEVAAGLRRPLLDLTASRPGLRVLEPPFMEIQQALGTTVTRAPETIVWLRELIDELKANDSIAASLLRSGRDDAVVR